MTTKELLKQARELLAAAKARPAPIGQGGDFMKREIVGTLQTLVACYDEEAADGFQDNQPA
jgi:hypothetical protein